MANNAAVPAGGRRTGGGATAWFWILGIIVVALVVWAIWAAFNETAGPNVGATLDDITDQPAAYVGQTVTVSGEVDRVIDPNSFAIGAGEVIVMDAEQLPGVAGYPLEGAEHQVVQVTGTVRIFNLQDMEATVGYDLQDELFTEYEGRPVIIARQMERLPGAS